jgi:hypothetical protein
LSSSSLIVVDAAGDVYLDDSTKILQDLSPVDLTGKQGKEGKEEPGHNKTQQSWPQLGDEPLMMRRQP